MNNCPWCGSKSIKGKVFDDWTCGSFKHGEMPWQSDACQIITLEIEVDRLQAEVEKLKETVRIAMECTSNHYIYETCKQVLENK